MILKTDDDTKPMTEIPATLIGGRRIPRPATVQVCTGCGEALGTNYTAERCFAPCGTCHAAIEAIWLADWQALLQQEGIAAGTDEEKLLARVVTGEFGRHPWTVLDVAMSLQRCEQCGAELGEAYPDCGTCGMAFGASIESEFGVTGNEHALHIGRWVLRYPHRNSKNVVAAWRLSMPRLLTGWLPTTDEAQRVMALIVAGRWDEVEEGVKRLDLSINQRG
jgi:hypothetical protein